MCQNGGIYQGRVARVRDRADFTMNIRLRREFRISVLAKEGSDYWERAEISLRYAKDGSFMSRDPSRSEWRYANTSSTRSAGLLHDAARSTFVLTRTIRLIDYASLCARRSMKSYLRRSVEMIVTRCV